MSQKKWIKLNELLNRIHQDENRLQKARFIGKLLGLLVDVLYYLIIKRGE